MTQKNSHYNRLIRRWHGHFGVIATLFLIFIVITGIVLNHEDRLQLDKREISASWLMRWYGLPMANPEIGYLMGENYFSWEGDKWALGNQLLSGGEEYPVGAIEVGGINYVATSHALYLYQADGQLLEKMEKQSLPAYPILALGKTADRVVLQTPAAMLSSADGATWQKTTEVLVWSSPEKLPGGIRRQMADMLAPGLSLQRILLDAHSGRIFGRYGPWFVDVGAIILLFLAMSGLWIYWRSLKQGKFRHKQ